MTNKSCREMLYNINHSGSENFTQVNFTLAPASAQPEIAFSACAPSRQTGLPPCQTTQGGTAPGSRRQAPQKAHGTSPR
jgi:hypothetical protein